MSRILVISRGVVGREMGSPGVRAYHMARVLAEELPDARVTLSVPNTADIESPHPRMKIVSAGSTLNGLRQMMQHDIIISRNFRPYTAALFLNKRIALDFFTTFWIEWMELSKRMGRRSQRSLWMDSNRHYLNFQLTLADYLICSNERQRDHWVGALSALGLITTGVYDRDSNLRSMIDVAPYGVQRGLPTHERQVLKGVIPGINPDDKVVIWNGLIVEWFDADTVIRAMARISQTRNDVKLFFLGTNHPDQLTSVDAPPVQRAIHLSKQLGIYERSVFFNVGWVPDSEIGNYLAESDIGVCAAFDNIEARYSFRTRFMDLFWAELPTVCTRGDVLAARIAGDPLGVAVAPGDDQALANAILRLIEDQDFYGQCKSNMAAVKADMSWQRVLEPLVEFCRTGKSGAMPKRQRVFPLLRRSIAYFIERSLVPIVRW